MSCVSKAFQDKITAMSADFPLGRLIRVTEPVKTASGINLAVGEVYKINGHSEYMPAVYIAVGGNEQFSLLAHEIELVKKRRSAMITEIGRLIESYKYSAGMALATTRFDQGHDDGFIAGLEAAQAIVQKFKPAIEDALHDLDSSEGLLVCDEDGKEPFKLRHPSIPALRAMLGEDANLP